MTSAIAGLRALAESLPAGTAIPVPRELLLELLADSTSAQGERSADPTVEEIGVRYGRASSTIRGWCEAGRFPGAYKLGREWRIPAAAIEAFETSVREQPASARTRGAQSLSDWRRVS